MTAKAALAKALLKGEILNVRNCFQLIGLTNCAREISRMIEKDFDVEVSRTPQKGVSRYGNPCTWVNYRLNKTEYNLPGIALMIAYVKEQEGQPKTDKQAKELKNLGVTPTLPSLYETKNIQEINQAILKQESLF